MTKAEFVRLAKQFDKRPSWLANVLIGSFLLALILWEPIKLVGNAQAPWVSEFLDKLASSWYLVLIAIVALLAWNRKLRARRAGLVCPHCTKLLLDQRRLVAIATGNCGDCGCPVFHDVPEDYAGLIAAADGKPQPTRESSAGIRPKA